MVALPSTSAMGASAPQLRNRPTSDRMKPIRPGTRKWLDEKFKKMQEYGADLCFSKPLPLPQLRQEVAQLREENRGLREEN